MDFGGMVGEASKSRHSVPNVGASDDVGVDEGTENAAIREAGVGSKLGGFGGTFRRGRSIISENLGQSRRREWFDGFRVCLARAGGGPAVVSNRSSTIYQFKTRTPSEGIGQFVVQHRHH